VASRLQESPMLSAPRHSMHAIYWRDSRLGEECDKWHCK
jgi:hypothetical protein